MLVYVRRMSVPKVSLGLVCCLSSLVSGSNFFHVNSQSHVGQIRSLLMIGVTCVSQGRQIPVFFFVYDMYGLQIMLSGGVRMICMI